MPGQRRMPPGVRPYQTDPSGQTLSPYLTFDQVSGEPIQGSIGAGIEEALVEPPPEEELPIHPLGAAPRAKPKPEEQQEEPQSYPSEEEAALRYKSGQQMSQERLPVHGPWEAAANAVNQIVGSYQQKRATRELRESQARQQAAMQKAIGGGGDINAVADGLINSNDPELVDRGLQIKLQIAAAQSKRTGASPTVREFVNGDRVEYRQWNPETQAWDQVQNAGGPRYKPASPGGGAESYSLSNPVIVPGSDDPRPTRFNRGGGIEYLGDDGKYHALPAGAQVVTPSVGAPVSRKDIAKIDDEIMELEQSISYFDDYLKTRLDAREGLAFTADTVMANAKTLFGGALSPEQIAALKSKGQFAGVLGLFRTAVLGPGVMTQADREFLELALAQNPNAFQNKQVMEQIIGMWIKRRRYRLEALRRRRGEYSQPGTSLTAPGPAPSALPPENAAQPQQPPQGTRVIRFDDKGRRIK